MGIWNRLRRQEAPDTYRERQLVSVLESITDAFCALDRQWRFFYINPHAEQYFNRPAHEMVGEVLWEAIPEAVDSEIETQFRQAMRKNQPVHFETRSPLTDRWIEAHGYPSDSGLCVYFREITQRKELEFQLRSLNERLEEQVQVRTELLRLLHEIASAANTAHSFQEALALVLERLSRFNGWCFGHAYLQSEDDPDELIPAQSHYERDADRFVRFREVTWEMPLRRGEGLPGRVFESGRPECVHRVEDDLCRRRAGPAVGLGIQTALAFPVLVGKEAVAVLEFFSDRPVESFEFDEDRQQAVADIGLQLGRVFERRRLQKELVDAVWEQQRHLGQELHESLLQELTGLAIAAEQLQTTLSSREVPEAPRLQQLADDLQHAQRQTVALTKRLFPVELDAGGLLVALEEFAQIVSERYDVECLLHCEGAVGVDDNSVATHLFRIAQEAVHDAVQRRGVERIDVSLMGGKGQIVLMVADDGEWIQDETEGRRRTGCRTMQYRASVMDARLTTERLSEGGTLVTCRVDVTAPADRSL